MFKKILIVVGAYNLSVFMHYVIRDTARQLKPIVDKTMDDLNKKK
jgi:hypothetical protein